MASDFGLSTAIFRTTRIFQDQMSQWMKETGDHPRELAFCKELFDRLCAEAAEQEMRRDKSILSMIESFKIAGPNGYVTIRKAD